MNAEDLNALRTFAERAAAEELKRRPAESASPREARVVTVTPADPLERT